MLLGSVGEAVAQMAQVPVIVARESVTERSRRRRLPPDDEHRAFGVAEERMASRPDQLRQLIGLVATDNRELNSLVVVRRKLAIAYLVVIG